MTDRNYGALRDSEKAIAFIERCINSGKPIAFDIEAGYTGDDKEGVALQQFHPEYIVVGISFTVSTEWARYIPLAHDDGHNVNNQTEVIRALWRMLNTGRGIAHNLAYELKGMSRLFRETLWDDPEYGEAVRESNGFFPFLSDTQLEVWLSAEYDPLRVGKDLKSVAKEAFGLEMTKFMDLFPPEDSELGPATKRGKTKFVRFNTRNSLAAKVINYACEDSVGSLMIHEEHYAKPYVQEDGSTPPLHETTIFKVEKALLPVLCEMEMGPVDENGKALGNMSLDWSLIHAKHEEVGRFRDRMNEEILETLSTRLERVININLGSVQQLAKVLYDPAPEGLGLPIKMRSEKTNAPSTSDDALKVIAKSDPIIKKILEWRQVVKLYGSYLNKYVTELNYAGTGVVFPNHNQFGALTGRMSVDQVSYQQWPKPYHFELDKGEAFDLNFRDLLVSPPGYRIVGFDFSQVELRVLAGMARERALLQAFNDDVDIHKATASQMMNIPLAEVTKKQRSQGKTLNFAVVYGSGANNIAEMLTSPEAPVSKEDAQELLNRYFKAFSGLKAWMDDKIARGREQHYVHTKFGRKFTVWEYKAQQDWIRAKGDRMCVNAPVQGGAADYLKFGMVRAQRAIKKAEAEGVIPKSSIRLMMTVHDALEFYVHDSVSTQTVIDIIQPQVSFAVAGLPDIRADWHEGKTWGSVVEIKLDKITKQITGYAIEDVDEHFETVEAAYAYLDAQNLKIESRARHDVLASSKGIGSTALDDRTPTVVASEVPMVFDESAPVNPRLNMDDLDDLDVDESAPKAPPMDWSAPADDAGDEPEWAHADILVATITLQDMPTADQYDALMDFLEKHTGQDIVVLETPEGSLELDTRHKIRAEHQPIISLMVGGAAVSFAPQTVTADLVGEGMEL